MLGELQHEAAKSAAIADTMMYLIMIVVGYVRCCFCYPKVAVDRLLRKAGADYSVNGGLQVKC